jgi:hypothetical protein
MIKNYNYDIQKYNFVSLFEALFKTNNLQNLHKELDKEYGIFNQPGKDTDTKFHNVFYGRMREGWPEFIELYNEFIRETVAPIIGAKEKLIYQRWPSFRVHLPNNLAVGGWHCDSDYNHPIGEVNFILALTPMFESNTTIAESEPGKKDFRQLEADPGEIIKFNGNKCMHGNLPNKTGVTRVSFDFRVLLPEDYNDSHNLTSISKGSKFLIGHYYDIMEI